MLMTQGSSKQNLEHLNHFPHNGPLMVHLGEPRVISNLAFMRCTLFLMILYIYIIIYINNIYSGPDGSPKTLLTFRRTKNLINQFFYSYTRGVFAKRWTIWTTEVFI